MSKRRKGGFMQREEAKWSAPNLTALMDILSNIIFFLMASFGAQTMELTAGSEVMLPASTSELSVKRAVSVAVGLDGLYVEDRLIHELSAGVIPEAKQKLASLESALRRIRAENLAKNTVHRDENEVVLLVADRRLEFTTIDRVLKGCARAGFTKFRLVVTKR